MQNKTNKLDSKHHFLISNHMKLTIACTIDISEKEMSDTLVANKINTAALRRLSLPERNAASSIHRQANSGVVVVMVMTSPGCRR